MGIFKSELSTGQIIHKQYDVRSSSFLEFLASFLNEEEAIKIKRFFIKKNQIKVILLDSIFVPKECRGDRSGSLILQDFLSSVNYPIILIADSENKNINLEKWYKSYGFVKVLDTSLGPFMIFND